VECSLSTSDSWSRSDLLVQEMCSTIPHRGSVKTRRLWQTVASTILIICGRQHQYTIRNDVPISNFLVPSILLIYLLYLFINLSSNEIQNGNILVPANPGSTWKMAIKIGRERERENLWPSNGADVDIDTVDYQICGLMQERQYRTRTCNTGDFSTSLTRAQRCHKTRR